MRVEFLQPSASQLAEVRETQKEFRTHWLSFQNMPFDCQFSGSIDDVNALDFLEYEGLGYPASSVRGTALIWGNVIANQLGMNWTTLTGSELLLEHNEPGNRMVIWPFARVLEMQGQSVPQFGCYAWLLDRVIRDFLWIGNPSERAEAWARSVLEDWKQEGAPWS